MTSATERTPIETQPQASIPGSSTLLIGPAGTGKTTAIPTFIAAGIETFVLITDPRGEESLIDAMELHNLPMDKLHWHYVAQASPSWATLQTMATTITSLSYKAVTEIKSGLNKQDYQQFFNMLAVCANFKCQRDGKEYGAIDSWGPNRAFAFDSMSGLNTMSMDMTIGSKPAAHQGEWGIAMNAEERFIKKCCSDLRCYFLLTAHLQRLVDELAGGMTLMVDALGTKLAPKIPKDFSDVVLAVKAGIEFTWSTAAINVDLKNRALPIADKLKPDFGQMVDKWKQRTAAAQTQGKE
ncbi:hypothetical protein LCGC14_0389340 [marine sediment metagenome]|uniref:Uncharacterized protein n=1 Tax=marine sediment metagenome TaxID=412755 RepID=A0A0F9THX5_9ZZZZ